MLDPKALEDLGNRLSSLIAASPGADIEKNVRAVLSGFFRGSRNRRTAMTERFAIAAMPASS